MSALSLALSFFSLSLRLSHLSRLFSFLFLVISLPLSLFIIYISFTRLVLNFPLINTHTRICTVRNTLEKRTNKHCISRVRLYSVLFHPTPSNDCSGSFFAKETREKDTEKESDFPLHFLFQNANSISTSRVLACASF